MEDKEIEAQTRELVGKIHEAMSGYIGPIRFMALGNIVGAGIVAYGETSEIEAQVFGAFILDVTENMDRLRELRDEAEAVANATAEKEDAETN